MYVPAEFSVSQWHAGYLTDLMISRMRYLIRCVEISVGHSVIVSHAYAAKLYREEFKQSQGGQIGITLNGDWALPYDNSQESEPPSIICGRFCRAAGSD